MSSPQPRVVVLGCGISGICAAHRLLKAGFRHVRILEATARSGGRIRTGRLGKTITEIGATYIHGPSEENPLFCLSRDYGLLDAEVLTPENQDVDVNEHPPWVTHWFSSSGRRLSAGLMRPALEMFYELVDNTPPVDGEEVPWASVGDFVRSEARRQAAERWKDEEDATRQLLMCGISAMLKVECCGSATHTMDDVDLEGFNMYECTKGVDCTLPSGFEGVIKNLMSELAADVVTYNRPVRCVHWNNTGSRLNTATVECEDGEMIAADHVIVTVPLGYLKKHHSTLFCPPLPAHKLESIQKLGFGTCNKIYVEFESRWWDADCEVIYLVWEDEADLSDQVSDISKSWTRKIAAFTVHKPSESCSYVLCGWIAGREAEFMETLPEPEVSRCITELIHRFTGNYTITVKQVLCTRWFSDPWTCGSYTHPAIGCSEEDLENMMEPLPASGNPSQPLQVLFAGEATHPCYYSTVHGALLTGWREADRLISHYSSISPGSKPNLNGV